MSESKKVADLVNDCLITGFNLNAFYDDHYNQDFKAAQKKYTKKFKKIVPEHVDNLFLKTFEQASPKDQADYLITLLRVADDAARQVVLHPNDNKLHHIQN